MPENLSSILDSTELTLLTTGWGRTEGPLWHAAGSVTFVDWLLLDSRDRELSVA